MIKERTLAYVFRTIYWLSSPKPQTLKDHLLQEIFVAENGKQTSADLTPSDVDLLDQLYSIYHQSDDYGVIFNFFYGDSASKSLEFPTYGMARNATGFDYATITGATKKTIA